MRSLILPGIGVIRRRDPRLALYPFALDDASAGVFRDLMTNVNASLSGGSTLLAQEKFRNDFQRLSSTFPGLGYRASGAVTNLLWALDPDNGSFEGGTKGTTLFAADASYTIPSAGAWHGNRYLETTVGPTLNGTAYWLASSVVASGSHVYSAWFKAKDAASVGRSAYTMFREHGGSNPGDSYGNAVVLSLDWQLSSVTRTISADRTAISAFAKMTNPTAAGQGFGLDGNILTAGATVPMFEEKECVATSASIPNPTAAAAPVSGVVFIWVPYAGNDGVEHNYLDCRDASGYGWRLYKSAANNLLIETTSAAGTKSMGGAVNGTNMAAGRLHAIGFAIHADNTQYLALNGAALTSSTGTAGREGSVNANLYLGSDKDALNHGNCVILPVLYAQEWGSTYTERMSSLQAPPPRMRRVA